MFERYWLGQGDWTISSSKFQDIVSTLPSQGDWEYITTVGNQKVWLVDFDFIEDKYGMLGTFTLFTDLNNSPIGLEDEINFEWKFGKLVETGVRSGKSHKMFTAAGLCGFDTGRTFRNEWVTRIVNMASLTSDAESYYFNYP